MHGWMREMLLELTFLKVCIEHVYIKKEENKYEGYFEKDE